MFEVLLTASLALAPVPSAYSNESLYGFVALSNDRIIDGYSYTDRRGTISAGLLYAAPGGFHASSELSSFNGNGRDLPHEHLLSLQTAAGWQLQLNENKLSLALLDYRFFETGSDIPAHQGIAAGLRRGALALEIAFEADKAYVASNYGSYTSDLQRMHISWSEPFGDDMQWSIGIGSARFDASRRRDFASGSLQWRWQQLDWQLMLVHANAESMPRGFQEGSETRVQLRISKPFRLR